VIGRRRSRKRPRTRIVFVTDLHGSETCFRKWLNSASVLGADCLVMGGDLTGKSLVPLVETSEGWRAERGGNSALARDDEELAKLRKRIRAGGGYDVLVSAAEQERLAGDGELREELFQRRMREVLRSWVELAEERLPATGTPAVFMLGNDDDESLLADVGGSEVLRYVENEVCELPGGHEMISFGYSTPTPWNTPREMSEEELGEAIGRLSGQLADPRRAIFNLHCPPRDTNLDQAPVLDEELRPKLGPAGTITGSVGSNAVREAIERDQPLLALHGHVHECPAVERLGSSLCVNAGSEYQDGVLRAAIIDLEADGVRQWQLISS
jgi:Icc-related predicted phosphoesterase